MGEVKTNYVSHFGYFLYNVFSVLSFELVLRNSSGLLPDIPCCDISVNVLWEYRNSTDEKDSSESIRPTYKVQSRPFEFSCTAENMQCSYCVCLHEAFRVGRALLLAIFSPLYGVCNFHQF